MYSNKIVKQFIEISGVWCEVNFTCSIPDTLDALDIVFDKDMNVDSGDIKVYNCLNNKDFISFTIENADVAVLRGGYYKPVTTPGVNSIIDAPHGGLIKNHMQLYMFDGAVCLNTIIASGYDCYSVSRSFKNCNAVISFNTPEDDSIIFNEKSKNMSCIKNVSINHSVDHSVLIGMFSASGISPDPTDVWVDVFKEHPMFNNYIDKDVKHKFNKGYESATYNAIYYDTTNKE